MVEHINASKIGNILYLDKPCCVEKDTTQIHIIVRFENF